MYNMACQDGMIVGPFFDEPDMHEDMRLELDNMSYEVSIQKLK